MNDIERIRELIRDLEREIDQMSGSLNLERMRKMLVVSECITANIRGYLFRSTTRYAEDKPAKPIPLPPFFSRGEPV